jgi:hypothetical protein
VGVAESEDEKGTGYLKLRFKSSCFSAMPISAMPNSVLFDRTAGVGNGFRDSKSNSEARYEAELVP